MAEPATPSWMNPSPTTGFNDTQESVLSTPEKQKQSRRTGNLKDFWTAGRAKRGTKGTFAGLQPPKCPVRHAAFEKMKSAHYAHRAAASELQRAKRALAKLNRRKVPMQVESMRRKPCKNGQAASGWQLFLANNLPCMGDMPFAKKMATLGKEWKNMKLQGNRTCGANSN